MSFTARRKIIAQWLDKATSAWQSSRVAPEAHEPEVAGSNPATASEIKKTCTGTLQSLGRQGRFPNPKLDTSQLMSFTARRKRLRNAWRMSHWRSRAVWSEVQSSTPAPASGIIHRCSSHSQLSLFFRFYKRQSCTGPLQSPGPELHWTSAIPGPLGPA